MKADFALTRFRALGLGIFLGLVVITVTHAQTPASAPARPAGPAKVRILVTENMAPAPGTAHPAATPAPPAPAAQAGKAAPAKAAAAAADEKSFTRTTGKTFSVTVVNLTAASIDVVVKTNVLAKDEAGKHEVLTEKTLENKLTLQPNRPESFTTDEVTFTHTTAHRGPSPKAGGNTSKRGGPPAPMEPASGHAYFGYKVDVFQGNDLVGSTVSENH